jgi:hypothetical protein
MELVRGNPVEFASRGAELCRCGLPTRPPVGVAWWRPDQDEDPGLRVRAVVRCGDQPRLRRVQRVDNNAGWSELGAMVNFYPDRTPPMSWAHVGHAEASGRSDGTPRPSIMPILTVVRAIDQSGRGHAAAPTPTRWLSVR